MKAWRFVFSSIMAAAFVACASDSSTVRPEGDAPSGGDAAVDADASSDAGDTLAPRTTNPYGAPYPTEGIGWKAREGSTPGERLANLTMPGYAADSDVAANVSMADFYDPEGRTHDVLMLLVTAAWDPYARLSLNVIQGSKKRLRTLSVLGGGRASGMTATLKDLERWRGEYPWAAHGLDPDFVAFKPAFGGSEAVPLLMVVDARTMEICTSRIGPVYTTDDVDALADACRPAP